MSKLASVWMPEQQEAHDNKQRAQTNPFHHLAFYNSQFVYLYATRTWRIIALISSFLSLISSLSGCTRPPKPGLSDVPPGLPALPGVFVDVNPRWSHDGKRIAFLRSTPDRKMQLQVADEDLERVHPLFTPELLCPDRPYSPQLQRYSSPDTLAWSPDDRWIAFERIEWFTFEDGERLPGTALWSFDTHTRAVQPLALHTPTYKNLFYYYHAPQWSPDGRYFAFVAEGINGQRAICVRPLALQPARNVTPRFDNYEDSDWPVWRKEEEKRRRGEKEIREGEKEDSSFILHPLSLFFRQGIVHALSVPPTETLRQLSPGNARLASGRERWRIRAKELGARLPQRDKAQAIAPRMGHLVWSPDGSKLAFTLTPDANDYNRYAAWVMNADGTGAQRVSPQDGRGYIAPVWIGNARLGVLSPHAGRFDVVTLSIDNSLKQILGVIATSDCDWSPDRGEIVYATLPDRQPRDPDATTLKMLDTGI